MLSLDPIEFHSKEDPYKNQIDSYKINTRLTEVFQTFRGKLNGNIVEIRVMGFQFIGVLWDPNDGFWS